MPGVNGALALLAIATMANGLLARRPLSHAKIADILDAFVVGTKYAIGVGAAAATVGIIVGVVTITGVGFKKSWIVTTLADSWAQGVTALVPLFDTQSATLFLTLVLTAMVCILLGCGVPTTATYIIMVIVAAPALGLLAVSPLVAHFFVFYYGVLADVTAPVAIAAYAGASIAGADPFKTGKTAFRLALGKVLMPFVFVFSPSILIMAPGFNWTELIVSTCACLISISFLSAAFSGWMLTLMPAWQRWLIGLAALPLIIASATSIAVGIAIAAPVLAAQVIGRKRAVDPI